ncbi:hypothetical protein P0136_00595 [Lentisphaerota bacterium ZTH]|nr:hypothetical protein JYG24_08260 [Lentisphaerota bacterium]WET06513.1 hypothetical protein P0136_00595 [Lentisphaerota bacterium ZTH]
MTLSCIQTLYAGIDISIIETAENVSIPPSIAENGKSLVYAAFNSDKKVPALFISNQQESGSFSKPEAAFDSSIKPEGIKQNFKVFYSVKKFIKQFHPGCEIFQQKNTGFNSPTIFNNIIAFSAILSNGRQGIFYAVKKDGKWKVFPIAVNGQDAPGKTTGKFESFDSPYITMNSEAVFLASLDDNTDMICSYDINAAQNNPNTALTALHMASRNLFNFYDISVAKGTFATRAETSDGIMSMFVFRRSSGKLIRKTPQDYSLLRKGKPIILGGPSYYRGKLAFSAYSRNTDNQIVSAIYSDAGENNYTSPIVYSGKKYESLDTTFTYRVRNPTLYVRKDKAYITFMGYPFRNKNITGVYLAEIVKGKVKLSAVAVPGQMIGDIKIKSALTGAVSIRKCTIPLLLKSTCGKELIAVARVSN